MAGKMVTINIFDVDQTPQTCQALGATIDEFNLQMLNRRWRGDIRLDKIQKVNAVGKLPVRYHLDFTKRRTVGPGKVDDQSAVSDIQLGVGEDFGEETAGVYVPSKKWLLILHNQAGIGPTRMMEYFNAVDPGNGQRHFAYLASPRLDPNIIARLGNMINLTSLDITAKVDALDGSHDQVGVALARATKPAKAETLHVTLKAERNRRVRRFLDSAVVRGLVDGLRANLNDVSVLKVKGEDPTTQRKDQVIDLIEHKLKRQYPVDRLQIQAHRYTLQSRWALLDEALLGWL